ncbi:PREDICTED: putative disease resistance protein RGA4 [Nicotiana attenuata]|nr:PREDICTED: putative disease resistance protein RGA4 [Nicotiana attenuata]
MPSLIEWKGMELIPTRNGGRDRVGVRMFPALEKLSIRNCQRLKSTPNQFEVPLLTLCSNLTSLVEISVYDVKELTCLPDEMLLHNNSFSLQHLYVSSCEKFRELPQSLYNLHSLKSLEIIGCNNFSSVPVPSGENHLTSLPSGMLEHCRSLESLTVSGCNNLVSLPLQMPSLSYLSISECPKCTRRGASPSHWVKVFVYRSFLSVGGF